MLQADPSDLRSEKLPFWEKTFDFYMPDLQFPSRDYEKSLYRLFLYYEDIGVASIKITPTSRRGQTYTPETIAIGSGGADGKAKIAIFDIAVSDVLIRLKLEVLCGQLSMIMATCEYEPKGLMEKGT